MSHTGRLGTLLNPTPVTQADRTGAASDANRRRLLRVFSALLLVSLAATALADFAWKPAPKPRFIGLTTADLPRTVGDYAAIQDYQMPPEVLAALAPSTVVSRTYGGNANQVDFVLVGGRDHNALHDPRSCFVGGGWRLEDGHVETLPGTSASVYACHARNHAGAADSDVLYFYILDGHVVNEVTQIRAAMLWNALLNRQNAPVYFFRFMQPLSPDPAVAAAAHDRMKTFAAGMWTALSPKVRAENK